MADEIVPTPIHFTQYICLLVSEWPQYTSFSEEWLQYAHVYKATVVGDTVTFNIDNGEATYRLRRDFPSDGHGIVAELIKGDTPGKLKAQAKHFQREG